MGGRNKVWLRARLEEKVECKEKVGIRGRRKWGMEWQEEAA